MTSKDQCREAFEAWASSLLLPMGMSHPWLERNSSGEYVFGQVPAWWEAWQAARSAPAAPVELPEPFALYDGEKWYANEEAAICSCANMQKLQKVYTEQQVRELLAAAPKLPQGDGWLPIESAPKDGTWLALWRTPEPEDSCMQSEPFIIARWREDDQAFAWPDEVFDAFTLWGRDTANAIVNEGERIYFADDFTHWMPLPQPPKEQG